MRSRNCRQGLAFGISILVALWVLNIGIVTYLLHFQPDCGRDEVLVARGKRALSGYICRPRPVIEPTP